MVETKEEKDLEEEENIQEKLQQANISLILDTYDDIFSDFDPRPFSERALSDDFLVECKKAAHDKGGGFELILSMPRDKRSINDEFKIKKRLREHFKKHAAEKASEMHTIKKEGFIWISLGIIIMLAVLGGFIKVTNNFLQAVFGVLEIPSWFLIWEGLGKIFFESRNFEPDYEFYSKMATVQITFRSY